MSFELEQSMKNEFKFVTTNVDAQFCLSLISLWSSSEEESLIQFWDKKHFSRRFRAGSANPPTIAAALMSKDASIDGKIPENSCC
jgi:hypothetical protein